MSETWLMLAYIIGSALLVVNIAFLLASVLNFYSLIDIAWSYTLAIAGFICIFQGAATHRHFLFLLMTSVWSLRLGSHLLFRITHQYPHEDRRYKNLCATWKGNLKSKFFIFFQMQAFSFTVLGLPLAIVSGDRTRGIGVTEIAAFTLWFLAMGGEILADAQLKYFKANPSRKNLVCNVGLWRFSRHPNYFFEWLIWCSFALYALPSSFGFLALLAPALIFYLLVFVTGIPPNEEQAFISRGEVYRKYQRQTNRFLPWFPKKEASYVG